MQRGKKKKKVTNIVYEISKSRQQLRKSQETKMGVVSSLTFQGIFTFFGASNGEGEGGLVEMRIFELSRCN